MQVNFVATSTHYISFTFHVLVLQRVESHHMFRVPKIVELPYLDHMFFFDHHA